MDDALGRYIDLPALQNFAFHPYEDAPMPRTAHWGNQRSCLFKFSAPASQKMEHTYHCWMEFSVSRLPGAKPILVKVLRSGCGCAIETAKDCVHKLILMLVIHKLTVRPDQVTPCTSLPCAWINPGHGVTYDVKTPLPFIPFLKSTMEAKKQKSNPRGRGTVRAAMDGDNGEVGEEPRVPATQHFEEGESSRQKPRRVMQISDSAGWRYRFNPVADNDKDKLADRTNPSRVVLKHDCWDAVKAAIGQRCAADVAHRGL